MVYFYLQREYRVLIPPSSFWVHCLSFVACNFMIVAKKINIMKYTVITFLLTDQFLWNNFIVYAFSFAYIWQNHCPVMLITSSLALKTAVVHWAWRLLLTNMLFEEQINRIIFYLQNNLTWFYIRGYWNILAEVGFFETEIVHVLVCFYSFPHFAFLPATGRYK